MAKLPKYMDEIVDFIAEKEEKYLGKKKAAAREEIIREAMEDSLTAKNPQPKKKGELKPKDNPARGAEPTEARRTFMEVFLDGPCGKGLSDEQRKKTWREIELFADHLSSAYVESVFKIRDYQVKNADGSVQLADTEYPKNFSTLPEKERDAIGAKVERNQYLKLFVMNSVFGTLMQFFKMTEPQVTRALGKMERGKNYKQLANKGNRLASTLTSKMIFGKLTEKYSMSMFEVGLEVNKEGVKRIYERCLADEARRLSDLGKTAAQAKKGKAEAMKTAAFGEENT